MANVSSSTSRLARKRRMSARNGCGSSGCVLSHSRRCAPRTSTHRALQPGTYLDHDTDEISYSDFINKELILFSMADNVRSIPSVADGLKPGQRKVIWACFKRKLKKEIKVIPNLSHHMLTALISQPHRSRNWSDISPSTLRITTASRV